MTDTLSGTPAGMWQRPRLGREQRREFRDTLARMHRSEVALELARACVPEDFEPAAAECTLRSTRMDRFVLQLVVRSHTGSERSFAVKVHAGDVGERMWALAQRLARDEPWSRRSLALPLRYLARDRALVFPWVHGDRLSDIVDERKPQLLRMAAALVGRLHAGREKDVPELTLGQVMSDTLFRCTRVLASSPGLERCILPLLRLLKRAAEAVDPVRPALIHGDLGAAQFLWTGSRLVLLDLDTLSRGDPAYDIGHFLGQLERRCTLDDTLPPDAQRWTEQFLRAYPMASLGVSARNVSFYRGVTLFRKMHTLCLRDPDEGPRRAARLAERPRAALEAVLPAPDRRIG